MTGSLVDVISQESTPTLVARQLRRLIGRGELKAGTRLNEAELSRQFGISRGPLREAMQRLTQERLLVSVRNRGVFVVELTTDDIGDVYNARSAIERSAASIVIAGDARGAGEQLLQAADAIEVASARGDVEASIDADVAFHTLLVHLSGSPRLRRMHATLMIETRMCMLLETRYTTEAFRAEEHREIARAVREADTALVERLIERHLSVRDS